VPGPPDLRLTEAGGEVADGPAAGLRARARVRGGDLWMATDPLPAGTGPAAAAASALLDALATRALAAGAPAAHWETEDDESTVDAVATAAGLPAQRAILHLRRPLPLEDGLVAVTAPVAVRPLRPGTTDEEAWVRCNNRSFAGHPDQGHETVASLRATMAEPWFDPAGLLVADGHPPVDEGGDLDGFCWTKVHPADGDGPRRGEIYVIGVDPSAGGRGLGRSLVVAGLAHLAAGGVGLALLYVDADNAPARRLYDGLGFTLHRTRRVRTRRAGPGLPPGQGRTE